jgi:hypothetical protein
MKPDSNTRENIVADNKHHIQKGNYAKRMRRKRIIFTTLLNNWRQPAGMVY